MLRFISEAVERGVREQRFDLDVAEEVVPGLLWTPAQAVGDRPLVLFGHGNIQHKRIELIVDLAHRLAGGLGYAVAALDAPNHGNRLSRADRVRQRTERGDFVQTGSPITDSELHSRERERVAAIEWRAAVDALQALPAVGTGRVAYWGVSMATRIGVPLVAAEPRIRAAVLGLHGLRPTWEDGEAQARAIAVPLLFLVQRDDQFHSLATTLTLFDAFGSAEKSMHVNPGLHLPLPLHERDESVAFLARHLGVAPGYRAG